MFNKHIQFVVLFVLLSSAGFLSFFLFFFIIHMAMHGSCLSWTFSLPAPPDCTRQLLRCQLQFFMFHCGERLSCFLKLHVNQKISSTNVFSPWMNRRNLNTLKSISELCALVWVVLELRHNYIRMCSKEGSFIFLLKMYTMDVLCKSKVVHFNTTVCVYFIFPTCIYYHCILSSLL